MTDTPPGGGPQLPPRWGAALGNIADAAVRAETLGDAVDKALWLDEAALEAAAPPAAQAERVNVSDLVMVACGEQRVERERERRDENERRLTGNHQSNRSHDGDSLNLDLRLPQTRKKKTDPRPQAPRPQVPARRRPLPRRRRRGREARGRGTGGRAARGAGQCEGGAGGARRGAGRALRGVLRAALCGGGADEGARRAGGWRRRRKGKRQRRRRGFGLGRRRRRGGQRRRRGPPVRAQRGHEGSGQGCADGAGPLQSGSGEARCRDDLGGGGRERRRRRRFLELAVILFFVCFFLRNCRIALSFPVFPLSLSLSRARSIYMCMSVSLFVLLRRGLRNVRVERHEGHLASLGFCQGPDPKFFLRVVERCFLIIGMHPCFWVHLRFLPRLENVERSFALLRKNDEEKEMALCT